MFTKNETLWKQCTLPKEMKHGDICGEYKETCKIKENHDKGYLIIIFKHIQLWINNFICDINVNILE